MKQLVHLTFSVTEGNMIYDALSEAGAERALARRFPHTWLFPVKDESLYNAVWEGDTSMSLDTEECRTIANALFARSCSQFDKGYETIGHELFELARKINRAAYPVRMANLAASCARSTGKEEAGDADARNPSPEAAPDEAAPDEATPDEATPMDENTISVRLTDAQMGKLVELTVAHNIVNEAKGVTPDWGTQDSLAVFLRPENLDEEIRLIFSLLDEPQSERDGGEGDVPTRNPSPEAAPDGEPETVFLNDEETAKLAELVALCNAVRKDGPFDGIETTPELVLGRLICSGADGRSTIGQLLDEDLRFYRGLVSKRSERDGGEGDVPTRNPSPEAAPDGEPETLVSVCDASGVVRDVTLDEAEAMREAAQGIYEGEPPEPQIIEDRTDAYFRLLGIADWPETPCAGDYGLSDCLAEPSEATLDFVDAFCVHS